MKQCPVCHRWWNYLDAHLLVAHGEKVVGELFYAPKNETENTGIDNNPLGFAPSLSSEASERNA